MSQPYDDLDDRDDPAAAAEVGLLDWGGYVLGAARRHVIIALAVFVAALAGMVVLYARKVPLYRVEAKILVQRAQAMPSVVRSLFEDAPGRSAWELVHRRENLVAIIQQTKLLEVPARRPVNGLRKLADDALQTVKGGARGEEDPLETMIQLLDKHLLVLAEEGTIVIQLDWPDPMQAYAVVQTALQNFLEARHVQEVTAMDVVISVLEERTAAARNELDAAVDAARRRRPGAVVRLAPPAPARPMSEELVRMRSLLESKQRALQDLEEYRRRQLVDLQAQYDQARNTLSEEHPTVQGLRQQLDSMTRESPQVETLRREEVELRKAYTERVAREGGAAAPTSPAVVTTSQEPSAAAVDEDERVRGASRQFEDMNGRLSAARVERDAAQAAFKYRYNVIWPPQVPREAINVNPAKYLGLGLVVAVLAALAAATAAEVLRGRVTQRWQLEQTLRIPVLGELKRD
jgi:hypothetical protein